MANPFPSCKRIIHCTLCSYSVNGTKKPSQFFGRSLDTSTNCTYDTLRSQARNSYSPATTKGFNHDHSAASRWNRNPGRTGRGRPREVQILNVLASRGSGVISSPAS